MSQQRAAEMEVEASNYWNSMRKLNAAYYADAPNPSEIEDAARDLGDIFCVTEWSRLERRCLEAVDPHARESVA